MTCLTECSSTSWWLQGGMTSGLELKQLLRLTTVWRSRVFLWCLNSPWCISPVGTATGTSPGEPCWPCWPAPPALRSARSSRAAPPPPSPPSSSCSCRYARLHTSTSGNVGPTLPSCCFFGIVLILVWFAYLLWTCQPRSTSAGGSTGSGCVSPCWSDSSCLGGRCTPCFSECCAGRSPESDKWNGKVFLLSLKSLWFFIKGFFFQLCSWQQCPLRLAHD